MKAIRKQGEHQQQRALIQWRDYNKHLIPELFLLFAIPNSGKRHISVACKMKAEGQTAGVWDLFLSVPRGVYHGMYIEMKFGKNKLTPEQLEFLTRIERHNYKAVVCYDWVSAKNAIIEYLRN